MEALVESALALLLAANAPGISPYSQIRLLSCDADCQRTPVCDEPKLVCAPPRYRPRQRAWYRYENATEATRRYAVIAGAMAQVSRDMVWGESTCAPPGADEDDGDACAARRRQRPWLGSARLLQVTLATVASHESGLRRDVHDGTTRGDCDYETHRGRRVVVPGSCRSSCLGQVNLPGADDETRRGHGRDDLVGLGAAATHRCIEAMVDRLSRARRSCGGAGPGAAQARRTACTLGVYGGVAGWRRDPRIAARVATFERLWKTRATVGEEVHDRLSDDGPTGRRAGG
ncbi:MAG: hypothetical protein AAGN82_27440 [Myxococcota bacterium]